MSSEAWSKVRKMIIVIAGLTALTWVMLSLADSSSSVAQASFPAFVLGAVALVFSYVAETVLRIVAERLPLPKLGARTPAADQS